MVRYNNHCKPIGNIVMQDIRLDDSKYLPDQTKEHTAAKAHYESE